MSKPKGMTSEKRSLRLLARTIDSQFARNVLRSNDLQLANLEINPADYHCAKAFGNDYLLKSYLSKWKGLDTGIDTEQVALSSFAAAEEQCRETNLRLRRSNPALVDPVIHRARRLIAKLLGPFGDVNDLLGGGWGPGATVEYKLPEAYLDRKIADVPFSVTVGALDPFIAAIKADREWTHAVIGAVPVGPFSFTRNVFNIVEGSRVTTVEKNAKTDRTIAIEPRGNMFLQKAVGSLLRSLLKRVGVDLDNQGINQELASKAHTLGLATIDLKAASDSVSIELVYLLLPVDWALYLDKIRSKSYQIGEEGYIPFEKLSSMGNGFTFEVESLIFWSLVAAVREGGVPRSQDQRCCAVYGDDLICPQEDALELITVLNYCGFTVNEEKSFIQGSFYESCGRHFFDGIEVTPIYQKEVVCCLLSHIRFYNRLSRWILRYQKEYWAREGHIFNGIRTSVLQVVSNLRYFPVIPLGVSGDDGYVVGLARLKALKSARVDFDYNHGWRCQTIGSARRARYPANEHALYAYQLRTNDRRPVPKLPWLDKPGTEDGFDGNIEARQNDDTLPPERGWRWVFPTSDVTLD